MYAYNAVVRPLLIRVQRRAEDVSHDDPVQVVYRLREQPIIWMSLRVATCL